MSKDSRALFKRKEKEVEEILTNEVFPPNSGIISRLRNKLLELSAADLECLAIIISNRRRDV